MNFENIPTKEKPKFLSSESIDKTHLKKIHQRAEQRMDRFGEDVTQIRENFQFSREPHPEERTVSYDASTQTFQIENLEKQTTLASLKADRTWGNIYYLDNSVPQELRAEYLEYVFLHEDLIAFEQQQALERMDTDGIDGATEHQKHSYKSFLEKDPDEITQSGFRAEAMVENVLRRFTFDHPEYNLQIESATVVEDVEGKIDFKIIIKDDKFGVKTEMSAQQLGIQFTTNSEKYDHKLKQIERLGRYQKTDPQVIKDILLLLVSTDDKSIRDAYKQWVTKKKPSGGPEQFWTGVDHQQLTDQLLIHFQDRIEQVRTTGKGMKV